MVTELIPKCLGEYHERKLYWKFIKTGENWIFLLFSMGGRSILKRNCQNSNKKWFFMKTKNEQGIPKLGENGFHLIAAKDIFCPELVFKTQGDQDNCCSGQFQWSFVKVGGQSKIFNPFFGMGFWQWTIEKIFFLLLLFWPKIFWAHWRRRRILTSTVESFYFSKF